MMKVASRRQSLAGREKTGGRLLLQFKISQKSLEDKKDY